MTILNQLRFLDIITTDAYLDNTIQFEADDRLYKNTVTTEILSGSISQYVRDTLQFITVPLDTFPKIYSLPMTHSILSKAKVVQYINSNFEEF